MMTRSTHTPLGALSTLVISLALGAVACGGETDERSGGPGSFGMQRRPAAVTTAPVRQGSFTVDAQFVGVLEATSAAELYARSSGQVVEVHADSGDRVRAGQVLARIEPDEAEQQVQQARAALRMAEATLSQREANLEIARATADRTATLSEQDLLSQQDDDAARADLVGAEAQLELARAQIEQAKANLSAAELELRKTHVIAPFDGWVGKRYLDLGDLASTNRPVFSVVDLSIIETTISITEKDASHIDREQTAKVRTEAFPGRVFDGRVARIASVFDPETNTTEAEIEVVNPEALLKPGMFANVSVTYRTEPTALLVPASAVVETETERYLYLAEMPDRTEGGEAPGPRNAARASSAGDGRAAEAASARGPSWVARRVPVRLLGTGTGTEGLAAVEVEGTDALDTDSRVIILGHERLADGAPVVLTEASGAAAPSARGSREEGGKSS